MNPRLPEQLASRLAAPLPGRLAQSRFQPELSYGRHFGPPPTHARPAAVLILLYPHEDQWHLPLTLRPAHLPDHGGQVSLPGGVIEPGETSQAAALRELTEELGVDAAGVELLGELSSLYLFNSNFRVTPWAATFAHRPAWSANPAEVAELFEVPLDHLLDPANTTTHLRAQRGLVSLVPCFQWQSHAIWGATSMILGELAALVAEFNSSPFEGEAGRGFISPDV